MRRSLSIAVISALFIGSLSVVAAADTADVILTGCLSSKGAIENVAIGDAPTRACKDEKETQVTWGERGPAGPRGPSGPIGPTGPAGPVGVYTLSDTLTADVPDDPDTGASAGGDVAEYVVLSPGEWELSCDEGDVAMNWETVVHTVETRYSGQDADETVEVKIGSDMVAARDEANNPVGIEPVKPISLAGVIIYTDPLAGLDKETLKRTIDAHLTCMDLTP